MTASKLQALYFVRAIKLNIGTGSIAGQKTVAKTRISTAFINGCVVQEKFKKTQTLRNGPECAQTKTNTRKQKDNRQVNERDRFLNICIERD